MGERWSRLRAMRIVSQIARGRTGRFRRLVSELEDEDLEDFLQQIDTAMAKKEKLGVDPVIQTEYAILVEERTRRKDARQETG